MFEFFVFCLHNCLLVIFLQSHFSFICTLLREIVAKHYFLFFSYSYFANYLIFQKKNIREDMHSNSTDNA